MTTHNPDNPNPADHPADGSGAPASSDQSAAEQPPNRAPDPITQLEQDRDHWKDLALRATADYQNYKRRVEEERGMLVRNASNSVLARLLPCVDDLERAVAKLPHDAPPGWSDGVRSVLLELHSFIKNEGVSRIDPAPGDLFDPHEHEAIHHQPSAEHPAGCALSTFRPGYRSPDRVLRPAQVIVSSGPGGPENNPDANSAAATAPPNNHATPTATHPDNPDNPDEKELITNG